METQPVRVDDIDDLGHVNTVVYLRWVQDVAAAHWESATSPAERADIGWVVLRHEIDYKHPARPGDDVIARARSLWCPVHPGTGRLRRIDSTLHDRFYAH